MYVFFLISPPPTSSPRSSSIVTHFNTGIILIGHLSDFGKWHRFLFLWGGSIYGKLYYNRLTVRLAVVLRCLVLFSLSLTRLKFYEWCVTNHLEKFRVVKKKIVTSFIFVISVCKYVNIVWTVSACIAFHFSYSFITPCFSLVRDGEY